MILGQARRRWIESHRETWAEQRGGTGEASRQWSTHTHRETSGHLKSSSGPKSGNLAKKAPFGIEGKQVWRTRTTKDARQI